MVRKWFWAQTLLVLTLVLSGLTPYSHASSEHMPFIERDNERTAVQAFWEVYKLPRSAIARIAFFTETKKLLGITEETARIMIENGQISTGPCGIFNLETASLLRARDVVWWRNVKKSETVAYAILKGSCVPWFLPACGNPVRHVVREKVVPLSTPPAPAPTPAEEMTTIMVNVGPCGCIQTGRTQIHYSSGDSVYTRIGHITTENVNEDVGMFMPTDCFSGNMIPIQVKKEGGNNEK